MFYYFFFVYLALVFESGRLTRLNSVPMSRSLTSGSSCRLMVNTANRVNIDKELRKQEAPTASTFETLT